MIYENLKEKLKLRYQESWGNPKYTGMSHLDVTLSLMKELYNEDIAIQVAHPVHYNSHPSGVECIEVVHDWDYCLANAAKYRWRRGLKDGQPSEKEDQKALQYLKFRVQYSPWLGEELTLDIVDKMIEDKIELILQRRKSKILKDMRIYRHQDWEYVKDE